MREPRPGAEYADPSTLPISAMFPELFGGDAAAWSTTLASDGEPIAALVSPDVAAAGLAAEGMSDVAGDLPSSVTLPDVCREASARRVIYLTHGGRVMAAVVPASVAEAGLRVLRGPSTEPGSDH